MPDNFWDFLVNLETILGILGIGLVSLIIYFWKQLQGFLSFHKRNSYRHLLDYVNDKLPVEHALLDQIRPNLKLCIVDDQPDDFPIEHLRDIGYTVDIFEHISLSQTWKLRGYHIVFLDIVGIVPQDPDHGGLTIIRKLKEEDMAPIVVAVSGQKFDTSANEFFNRADHVMKKPIFEDECERLLSDLSSEHYLPHAAASRIDRVIDLTVRAGTKWQGLNNRLIAFIEGDISDKRCRTIVTQRHSFDGWGQIQRDLELIRKWIKDPHNATP